jgi:hypothetical protein
MPRRKQLLQGRRWGLHFQIKMRIIFMSNTGRGVQWLCEHFKKVQTSVACTVGQISNLFMHTQRVRMPTHEIESWLHAIGLRPVSNFKTPFEAAATPLLCTTHHHVTISLFEGVTHVILHPLAAGPLTIASLQNSLLVTIVLG